MVKGGLLYEVVLLVDFDLVECIAFFEFVFQWRPDPDGYSDVVLRNVLR